MLQKRTQNNIDLAYLLEIITDFILVPACGGKLDVALARLRDILKAAQAKTLSLELQKELVILRERILWPEKAATQPSKKEINMPASANAEDSLSAITGLQAYQKHLLLQYIEQHDLRGKVVLEAGSDTALATASALLALGAGHVYAVNELLPEALVSPDDRITIIRANLENARLGHETADLVFGIAILEHIENLRDFASKALNLLKPNGQIYLQGNPLWTSPHGHHTWLTKTPSGKKYYFNTPQTPWEPWEHLCMRDKREAEAVLMAKGISCEDVSTIAWHLFKGSQASRKSPTEIENAFKEIIGSACSVKRFSTNVKRNAHFERALENYSERDLLCAEMRIGFTKPYKEKARNA